MAGKCAMVFEESVRGKRTRKEREESEEEREHAGITRG